MAKLLRFPESGRLRDCNKIPGRQTGGEDIFSPEVLMAAEAFLTEGLDETGPSTL